MITNPALKHADENIPSSDSEVPSIAVFSYFLDPGGSPQVSVVSFEALVVTEVSHPLSRGPITFSLYVVDIFFPYVVWDGTRSFSSY